MENLLTQKHAETILAELRFKYCERQVNKELLSELKADIERLNNNLTYEIHGDGNGSSVVIFYK